MACASAAAVAAASSGLQVCEASSRMGISVVSLKASPGQVICLPRTLSLKDPTKKVRAVMPQSIAALQCLLCVILLSSRLYPPAEQNVFGLRICCILQMGFQAVRACKEELECWVDAVTSSATMVKHRDRLVKLLLGCSFSFGYSPGAPIKYNL
uniref:Uncharacterized protein n=1 Tax=Physcomitrium patens TaxID=3218 RepID=A0A7I3Z3J6_PHYPA